MLLSTVSMPREASLPNFWVGALTHDSINSALASGIAAEEIVAYLQHQHQHHPESAPPCHQLCCLSDTLLQLQASSVSSAAQADLQAVPCPTQGHAHPQVAKRKPVVPE
ncbi:transcription factor Tfb2, partial [Haematococcus lacustris]